ncbi:MAG: PH domain-containing protein [Phycisphaerales bacterium]
MIPRSSSLAPWMYRGIWGFFVKCLRVPDVPPSLPLPPGATEADRKQFHPSPDFLRYLKFWFWLFFLPVDLVILVLWLIVYSQNPTVSYFLAVPAFLIAVVPDVIAYIAIHLRYDTTWYVLTPRAVRVRRGIWTISECTATFENVQNISIKQGPVQRYFGIAHLAVDTAGAGPAGPHGATGSANQVILEGLADVQSIRDLIAERVRASKTAGLGDERTQRPQRAAKQGLSAAHVELLREIRDHARALAHRS